MARPQKAEDSSYRLLRNKILRKTVLLFLAATVLIFQIYDAFLYRRFADIAVRLLDLLIFHQYDRALSFYQHYIRNYMEVYFFIAIASVFALALRFYLNSFTLYFREINEGINSILEPEREARLSPELYATERKINSIKARLQREEQAAREAEQRKDDLVMYLAHDIRTPLTSVIGYLSLLEEDPEMPPEQRGRYTRIALDKANRLEAMVEEFFEITRMNSRREALRRERIDLCYLLVQLTDELTPLLARNGNRVRMEVDEALTVTGDPDKLARAFGNLLKNAAAYSTPGTEIKITARETEELVILTFQNRAEGIDPAKLPELFRRFYRLDEARSSNTGGAGLGLAIAREIVTLHGGTLTAAGGEQEIRFILRLPKEPS